MRFDFCLSTANALLYPYPLTPCQMDLQTNGLNHSFESSKDGVDFIASFYVTIKHIMQCNVRMGDEIKGRVNARDKRKS